MRYLQLLVFVTGPALAQDVAPDLKMANPTLVAEVMAGARAEASAAWWGFNAEDVTETLQAAIQSPVKKLIVPDMGTPWIVRPVALRGDLELVFEPGVLVLAKAGEFKGPGDSLFAAHAANYLTIRGYGATLRMRKADYQSDGYEKAEWRMGFDLNGCSNVLIEGVRIESTGGDGIYVGAGKQGYCKDVTIRNVFCDDNHRQGISVIGAENLLIENVVCSNTDGTPPSAGIDIEPNDPENRLVNCVIRNCLFENNTGDGMVAYLKNLGPESPPVAIRFENCLTRMRPSPSSLQPPAPRLKGGAGMCVGAVHDGSVKGAVEFVNCVSESSGREGARIYDVALDTVQVRFTNCTWRNPWQITAEHYPKIKPPIAILLRRPEIATSAGNVVFSNCHVFDTEARPALQFLERKAGEYGVARISGDLYVHAPGGANPSIDVGPKSAEMTLRLHAAAP